jgi:hypothetical protein
MRIESKYLTHADHGSTCLNAVHVKIHPHFGGTFTKVQELLSGNIGLTGYHHNLNQAAVTHGYDCT